MSPKNQTYLSKVERILMSLIFGLGLFPFVRAFYWIINSENAKGESPFYETLASIAPLFVWALPFLIGGVLLMIATFFVINQNTKKKFDVLLSLGSFSSMIGYLLISLASMDNNLNWLTPVNNTIYFVLYLSLLWIGLVSLWTNRKKKN